MLTSASDLPAANLTGTLPAIDGSNLTNLPASGLGIGQTWSDVSGSRATGTTYTNSTGKTIFVAVSPTPSVNCIGTFLINGSSVAISQHTPSGGGGGSPFSFAIPDGDTYSVTNNSNFSIAYWWELR